MGNIKLESIENVIGAVLKDSDLKKIYNGKKAKIKVIASFIDGDVPKDDEKLVKEGTDVLQSQVPGLSVGNYLDISVSKYVDGKWKSVSTLAKRLKIVLELPDKFKQKEGQKYIIRIHDGEYILVKDTDEDDNTFSFSTKYFSTYALTYIDVSKIENSSSKKVENVAAKKVVIGSICGVILMIVVGLVLLKNKRKYKNLKKQ